MPQLNGKRDAVPGSWNHLTIEADEPGTFLGQCAEFCGLAHGDMYFSVNALAADEYDAWVAEQTGGVVTAEVNSEATNAETDAATDAEATDESAEEAA